MRTLVRGGWVIGHAQGGHCLYRDGIVVVEDDRILHVGYTFQGRYEREIDARGKIVSPGLIDTHVHSGMRLAHRLLQDAGRPDFFGQPRSHFTIAREGTTIPYEAPELAARYTVAELLRNGTTTFVEIAGNYGGLEELAAEVGRLGLRAYLGPGFDDYFLVGDAEGRIKRIYDPAKGSELLAGAREFIVTYNGAYDDRVRGILAPREADVCSPSLLRAARHTADALGVPITCHAAYNIDEFYQIVTRYRCTPIELLQREGLLGPDLLIGHGNFPAETRVLHYASGRDLELIAAAGATVAHSPINLVRRGRSLDHWERYRKAGVRLSLGTDTWPRDLFQNMRMASYMGKILAGSFFAAPAAEVFTAATLGGAEALGRPDLGRLAPGAKADLIIIDTPGLRWGAVRDPVKSLVDCAVGDDVELVMVDGVIRMEKREIPGVDLEELRRVAQAEGERFWARLPEWNLLGQTAEEACPWSFPLLRP
jgi:cytosine/adenosine deaminase-related metal-dependent hydrolase